MTKEMAAGMAPRHQPIFNDCTGIVDFLHVNMLQIGIAS